MDNVASICHRGILSHNQVRQLRLKHVSVGAQAIQDRRTRVTVPGGQPLHDYVNLYICARNPMLFKRLDQHRALCVLRIAPDVLDLRGVVVTDCNASSKYVRFAPAPHGLAIVDREMTFLLDWTDSDQIAYWRKVSAKCAEVLVPDCVPPHYLMGAYVSCPSSLTAFNGLNVGITGQIDRHLFFGVEG